MDFYETAKATDKGKNSSLLRTRTPGFKSSCHHVTLGDFGHATDLPKPWLIICGMSSQHLTAQALGQPVQPEGGPAIPMAYPDRACVRCQPGIPSQGTPRGWASIISTSHHRGVLAKGCMVAARLRPSSTTPGLCSLQRSPPAQAGE